MGVAATVTPQPSPVQAIKRPRLKPGSRLAVVSPASAAKPELVERGMDALFAHGYRPFAMPHALSRGPLYYAGSAAERAQDLQAAFADPTVDAVICTRGGWGSAELLPLLDWALLAAHPKPFIGYSDHTSLHSALWNRCRMQSFYAPMVAADWSQWNGVDACSWLGALTPSEAPVQCYTLGTADGLRVLREGTARGRLLGGCLSVLEAGLGTPWALRIDEPCVLFLEDIHVKPYQWDRMLQHLRFAGLLEQVYGVVLGDMTANVEAHEMELLQAACLHALSGLGIPVAIGLRCGHVSGENRSVLLGAMAELVCSSEARLTMGTTEAGDRHLAGEPRDRQAEENA